MFLKQNIYFIKKVITFKRFWNTLIAFSAYLFSLIFRKVIVWGYPPILFIEPTDICNLKCPLCPSGNGTLKRAKGYMSLSVFKKVIDESKDKTSLLVLWNQGEPFLNKDFLEMVRYASDHKLFSLVSTNANIMPDAEELVKSGLDSLIISIDGATQETYNKYRVNGDLETVISNVKKIVVAKRKLKSITPFINWQFLVMKHNEHELEEIKKIAKETGVDNVIFKTVQIYQKSDIKEFLPINPKFRRYKIEGDNFELKFGVKNRCYRIWTKPVVNWNGEMSICCFDKDIEFF